MHVSMLNDVKRLALAMVGALLLAVSLPATAQEENPWKAGNYWQGMVAESMGYAVVLYLDALFAMLVILVIPFLREREERPTAKLVTAEPLLATG